MTIGKIKDFHRGTTKRIALTCKLQGVAQDITGDAVTIWFKAKKGDTNASAAIEKAADVATEGANGIARITITPSESDVTARRYVVGILWVTAGGDKYVGTDQEVEILERVSDI